jgi:hypothetical protein
MKPIITVIIHQQSTINPMSHTLRVPTVIVAEFNDIVKQLITRIIRQTRSEFIAASMEQLRDRALLLRRNLGSDAVLRLATPWLVKYADQILNPDQAARETFFLGLDVRAAAAAAGHVTSTEDEMFFSLVDHIRGHYRAVSAEERSLLYSHVRKLFECCVEYGAVHQRV